MIKVYFRSARPDIEHLVTVSTLRFPSGYAMLSAVVYLTLGVLLARAEKQKRFKIFFFLRFQPLGTLGAQAEFA